MTSQFQNLNLSAYAFNIDILNDLVFFQYLNGNFLSSNRVSAQLDFTKGALTYCLANIVMTYGLSLYFLFLTTLSSFCMMFIFRGTLSCLLDLSICCVLGLTYALLHVCHQNGIFFLLTPIRILIFLNKNGSEGAH